MGRFEDRARRLVGAGWRWRQRSRGAGYGIIPALVLGGSLFANLFSVPPAFGETFNQASSNALNDTCRDAILPDGSAGPIQLGAHLAVVCAAITGSANGSGFTASGFGASPQSGAVITIQQRLQSVREAEEEKPETRSGSRAYAMRTRSDPLADGSDRRVTASPGPDLSVGLGAGTTVYLAAGGSSLIHLNNRFEDGYEASVPTATAGADYRVNDRLLFGLAFTYSNLDGSYDDGGGFDKNAYGPILYGTFLPFEGAFINVALGYAHLDDFNKRRGTAVVTTVGGTGVFGQTFAGNASAHYDTNQYTASFLAGYDYPIDNVTIGPRLGTAFAYSETDDFTERGDTGLELSYGGLNRTSVQTSLGVQATIALPTSWGLLLPQAAVAWVHEYADDARNIQAQFVEADPSPTFTFQREPPARDWANIGVGLTAVLPNGLQPFVQFATMQGNKNYVSYGGTVGVRFGN